jgi:two-component system, OmpR family, KDP operon response regulator KdpE
MPSRKKILVVDDDPAQIRLTTRVLVAAGYDTLKASSGQEAVRVVLDERPDLVLLDVMMPEIDGWQTCRMIREITDIPVFMMTGKRNSEEDVVRGLESGADDYLAKPVGSRELVARIRSVFRRAEKITARREKKKTHFTDDYLTIDLSERRVIVNSERLKLTPREFHLLTLLVEHSDHIVSHQKLLEQIWGFEYIDDIDYVRIYISHLRQKIEPDPSTPRYILTEPGVGYYFSSSG